MKIAIITGVLGGIGKASALALGKKRIYRGRNGSK